MMCHIVFGACHIIVKRTGKEETLHLRKERIEDDSRRVVSTRPNPVDTNASYGDDEKRKYYPSRNYASNGYMNSLVLHSYRKRAHVQVFGG